MPRSRLKIMNVCIILHIILYRMDMELPSADELLRVAKKAAKLEGETYIHCANGTGYNDQ